MRAVATPDSTDGFQAEASVLPIEPPVLVSSSCCSYLIDAPVGSNVAETPVIWLGGKPGANKSKERERARSRVL